MAQSDCVFCKIANGEIPSRTLYEDDSFRVILDISPASKGHAILIPKRHAASIYELPEEDAREIFVVAKKAATALRDVLSPDGLNVLQNNGEAAGQTVFHLHVHLIPRYAGDKVNVKWSPDPEGNALDDALVDRLREALR